MIFFSMFYFHLAQDNGRPKFLIQEPDRSWPAAPPDVPSLRGAD